jgi:hypothetical protein
MRFTYAQSTPVRDPGLVSLSATQSSSVYAEGGNLHTIEPPWDPIFAWAREAKFRLDACVVFYHDTGAGREAMLFVYRGKQRYAVFRDPGAAVLASLAAYAQKFKNAEGKVPTGIAVGFREGGAYYAILHPIALLNQRTALDGRDRMAAYPRPWAARRQSVH